MAKLSRAFYDQFGDALTDELVNCLNAIEGSYRAELRDLFDAHFGRFEAKFERRLVETKAEVMAEIGSLRSEIGSLKTEIGPLRAEGGSLRSEIGAVADKLGMLKWTFAVWIPVTLGVIGLYFRR